MWGSGTKAPPPPASGNVEPTIASKIARLCVRKEERAAKLSQKAAKSVAQRNLSGFMSIVRVQCKVCFYAFDYMHDGCSSRIW